MCESPMDRDAPVMLAWATFKATEAYENAARWAVSPQDTEGSLWRAFLEGYEAAGRARGRAPRPAQDAVREAAETISRIYFEIAAEEVGEDWVRAEFKRRFAAARAAQGGAEVTAPAKGPLSVKCPECMVHPGEECIEKQSCGDSYIEVLTVQPHAARVRAAEREERGKEKGEV